MKIISQLSLLAKGKSNQAFHYCLLAILACFLFIGCEGSTPMSPATSTITAVLPNSNPVGYPVLIEGSGFTAASKLYFDGTEALIESRSDTFLSALVPAGASGIGVTISVQNPEEEAFELEDSFTVLGSYPSDLPQSPPSIIFPTGLTATISSISQDEGAFHFVNVYDPRQQLFIWRPRGELGAQYDPSPFSSYENAADMIKLSISSEDRSGVLDFGSQGGGAFTAGRSFYVFPNINNMHVERSKIWQSDTYKGEFFDIDDFNFPLPMNLTGTLELTTSFLLLTSIGQSNYGRQSLFVALCDESENECK